MAQQEYHRGYVRTGAGDYLIMLPDDVSQWGFRLYNEEKSWDGGIDAANSWEAVSIDSVPDGARKRLDWMLEKGVNDELYA